MRAKSILVPLFESKTRVFCIPCDHVWNSFWSPSWACVWLCISRDPTGRERLNGASSPTPLALTRRPPNRHGGLLCLSLKQSSTCSKSWRARCHRAESRRWRVRLDRLADPFLGKTLWCQRLHRREQCDISFEVLGLVFSVPDDGKVLQHKLYCTGTWSRCFQTSLFQFMFVWLWSS